ncbi:GGDEF domain-containing protein [Clostridium chromiireducens]|uniref:GGDEF domain-containing protein n=1 Tax=Clostridium chromiireducens TaxID=225345 RepID=A0A1V4IE09_9CLOT|nr:GGDEF domain-containing protein [Clostridium chromiireducens]OPJ57885.1 response regulator PleD [Clostridium chromiireducens]RII35546.1 GGDEF domain-containing protein [Clostridium chromiireducens]
MSNFFINILLLISAIFIGGHLFKDAPFECNSKICTNILLGLGGGILAIGMMIYSINIDSTKTLVDLRVIALMLIYYIGGILPSLITGIIVVIFRTLYFGINQSSIVAVFQILIIILSYPIISKLKLNMVKKWLAIYLVNTFFIIGTYYYLLFNEDNVFKILLEYFIISTIAAILSYYLLKYVRSSNELYKRYKNEATKDFLTGLNNTRQFDLIFNKSVANAKEKDEKLSCLMVDIDHFKRVNDTYGHAVGDIILRELAVILKNTCRVFDAVSRVGGEEFCVLLIDCSKDRAIDIGKRICDEVKNHEFEIVAGRIIRITVSVGVSAYPESTDNIEMLLKQADDSLYKAKQTGRDRVCSADNK